MNFSQLFNNSAMAKILDYIIDNTIDNSDFTFTRHDVAFGANVSYRNLDKHFPAMERAGLIINTNLKRKKKLVYKLHNGQFTLNALALKGILMEK